MPRGSRISDMIRALALSVPEACAFPVEICRMGGVPPCGTKPIVLNAF